MAYRIRLRLKGTKGRKVVIEEGALFEVADLDANSPQTLRSVSRHEFTLDDDGPTVYELDTECLNPTRRSPSKDPMRVTPLVKARR